MGVLLLLVILEWVSISDTLYAPPTSSETWMVGGTVAYPSAPALLHRDHPPQRDGISQSVQVLHLVPLN